MQRRLLGAAARALPLRALRAPPPVHPRPPARGVSFYNRAFERFAKMAVGQEAAALLFQPLDRAGGEQRLVECARYLQHTLPIRIAKRIVEIHHLPYIVGINPYMQEVHDLYVRVFQTLIELRPIQRIQDEHHFVKILPELLNDTRRILPLLAKASKEIAVHMAPSQLQTFFDTLIER